ncbi:FAD-dependent monooxygenase [Symbioplanes lichenis]|uniref:FAD-dependent monooxygenase n=1 Tax=Symbioplanes lichenis TaxID=1629072 RepID=UPI00273A3524|nr:FAD-dependent monooxygenase [Actinoplanes lichenis]
MPRVLVVGAGIAGDTLAVSLDRAGWEVTVVENAPDLRTGGQTVDLRGASTGVLDRLGVLDACRAALVDQRGIAWVDASGRRLAAMPVEAFGGAGFVSSEELLRTDLARILHAAGSDRITYRWSDTVEAIDPADDHVTVSFRGHPAERFDLVVGADGAHSRTRSLVFGPEDGYRHALGLGHAWFTLAEHPDTPSLDGWSLVHNAPGSRLVGARPGHPGTQEIGFSFPMPSAPRGLDREDRFALLRTTFAGVGWRTPELLAALPDATDFALDTFDQIRMDTWHRGRVVLLGDSAWCVSPLSGLGTALALQGAEALAAELTAGHRDLATALARFEHAMRPATTAAAKLIPGRVRSYAPKSALGIKAVAGVMRFVQSPFLTPVIAHVGASRGH